MAVTDVPTALRHLERYLRDGTPMPSGARLMLRDLQQQAYIDLTKSFRSRGGKSVRYAWKLADRDEMIRQLWLTHPDWKTLPPVAAAPVMSLSARDYEARVWTKQRNWLNPPQAEPNRTWWLCLNLEVDIPDTKRLRQILSGNSMAL